MLSKNEESQSSSLRKTSIGSNEVRVPAEIDSPQPRSRAPSIVEANESRPVIYQHDAIQDVKLSKGERRMSSLRLKESIILM